MLSQQKEGSGNQDEGSLTSAGELGGCARSGGRLNTLPATPTYLMVGGGVLPRAASLECKPWGAKDKSGQRKRMGKRSGKKQR